MEPRDKLIVALDVSEQGRAAELVDQLVPHVGCFKIGYQLMNAIGNLAATDLVIGAGGSVFYDGKFHDIPNTMAAAAREVALKGAKLFNVHCLSGPKGMRAVRQAIDRFEPDTGRDRPLILGVTMLTSHDDADLEEMEVFKEIGVKECVAQLAVLANKCGLDGIVASPQEILLIRDACELDFLIVTPGIRPMGSSSDDQARTATPASAIAAGADYIVVGRPIISADDPVEAANRIVGEIASAM